MANSVGCVWEVLTDSLVVTYSGEGATPEQWISYLEMIRAAKGRGVTRFLIYADVSPPTSVLADIASVARGEPWQVSLISPSTAVRFAASTFSFVTKGFRFFVPEKVPEALAHLGCDVELQKRGLAVLERLRGAAR
ncbi:MAG TPA: hypothetical protein VFN67_17710 [Polyangiales bacterium]|nr:hypothetical protein [Polyangiales bacterium]